MTIKDIAKLAGVSISTVSKIVNNKDESINPETRKRVLDIVKKYNYTPYGTVKTLSTNKTFRIGVLFSASENRYALLNGIIQTAQEHGYMILLLESHKDPQIEIQNIRSLCGGNVDGVIWEPVSKDSLESASYFTKQQIPYCLVNSSFVDSSYSIDFQKLGYSLTQKLLDYSHTNIACLLENHHVCSQMFLEGFQRCLYDHHILFTDHMCFSVSDPEYIQKLFSYRITGVVSSHFASTLEFYQQTSKLHYYIPDNLSLVSIIEDLPGLPSYPRISGIRAPYFELGVQVCKQLIGKCEKSPEEDIDCDLPGMLNFNHEESVSTPSALRKKRLISVGSINMDITFRVDRLPESGKSSTILNTYTTVGGKGVNQAIGAARLGHEVAMIGKLGNDTDSASVFQTFEKEHVATHGLLRDFRQLTGKAYIYTESNGESAITIQAGANGNLTPEDIFEKEHLFQNATFCMISTEIPVESAQEAARLAKKWKVKTILKPAALSQIPDSLLSFTDIFVPNRKEAAILCPLCSTVEEQADFFFRKGIPVVIITLGHKGCYLKTADTTKYFPAMEMHSIDTTGGADAFISALASFLCDDFSLENSIRIAMYAAAFCISRQGVVPALVDRNSLKNYIQQSQPDLLAK